MEDDQGNDTLLQSSDEENDGNDDTLVLSSDEEMDHIDGKTGDDEDKQNLFMHSDDEAVEEEHLEKEVRHIDGKTGDGEGEQDLFMSSDDEGVEEEEEEPGFLMSSDDEGGEEEEQGSFALSDDEGGVGLERRLLESAHLLDSSDSDAFEESHAARTHFEDHTLVPQQTPAADFFLKLPPELLANPLHLAFPDLSQRDMSNLADTLRAWAEGEKYETFPKEPKRSHPNVRLPLHVVFTLSMNQWAAQSVERNGMLRHYWPSAGLHYVLLARRKWDQVMAEEFCHELPSAQLVLSAASVPYLWRRPATEVMRLRIYDCKKVASNVFQFQQGWKQPTLPDAQAHSVVHRVMLLVLGDNLLCTSTKLLITCTGSMVESQPDEDDIILTWTFDLTSHVFQQWSQSSLLEAGHDLERRTMEKMLAFFEEESGSCARYEVDLEPWATVFDDLFPGD